MTAYSTRIVGYTNSLHINGSLNDAYVKVPELDVSTATNMVSSQGTEYSLRARFRT